MKKSIFLLLYILLVIAGQARGQYKRPPPPKKPKVYTFPAYSKYKRKDTVAKIDPYTKDSLFLPIPMARQLFHDNIYKEQVKADIADGLTDSMVNNGDDSLTTYLLSNALLYKVDSMKIMIENMPANGREAVADNQQKIRYLRAVWEMMRMYTGDPKPDAEYYINLVSNMNGMLKAVNEHTLTAFVKANPNLYSFANIREFADNDQEARAFIYTAIGRQYPQMMIKRLAEFAKDTFAGEIIKADARIEPDLIFSYAMSTNFPLKNAVYKTQDDLVQAIVEIAAHSKAPLKAFPFLSDLYYKRKTIEEIDQLADNPSMYFDNLVRLKMQQDSIGSHAYTEELKYRALKNFVRQMNELHESKDEARFKCIDSMSATSLYYIMVYGQDEIYTSSFLGTFKRMMERMKPQTGSQLLDTLQYDHFRTFIRMCAGYNTLSDFLGTMQDTAKTIVMTRFIGGLQNGKADDLEDAVDVADAFGSIRDSALSAFLEKKVKENYEQSFTEKSKKGLVVYSLLAMLFESNKISGSDTGASVTSLRLHLPPINKVPYNDLVNDSGIVYQQVFFFGDKDGQDSYESYMSTFKKDTKWKVTTEKYWNVIASTGSSKRIVIYANLPLKEPEDEDAQDSLSRYLDANNIHSSIIIHRGHSYHLAATIKKLTKDVKIVILGSCGGYHNLALVLDKSPNAHIISSKQTGTMSVNEPILRAMNARLQEGADVNWINMWQELDEYFAKKPDALDKFTDYVPPYKNLGAIFIKAYRRMMDK
ncbi:MAG: hypothetical protein JWQ38_2885 [Flavipsychrobacter sp.]|nr:hypothetical protein [Flavipsychrobacter sp.]